MSWDNAEKWNPNDPNGPRVTTINLASQLAAYIMRAQELGAGFTGDGGRELNPDVAKVVEALHHVLAGGEVEVTVKRSGLGDVYNELQRRLSQGLEEARAINNAAGFYLTAAA